MRPISGPPLVPADAEVAWEAIRRRLQALSILQLQRVLLCAGMPADQWPNLTRTPLEDQRDEILRWAKAEGPQMLDVLTWIV